MKRKSLLPTIVWATLKPERCALSLAIALLLAAHCPQLLAADEVRSWAAKWITVPEADPHGYGVYYFRKAIDLAAVPATFPIRVSGDTRYKLYVNGTQVSLGPARSDLTHWRYEEVDIAPQLQAGTNVVAAVVWHEGDYKPEANVTYRTAFILQGDSPAAAVLNTDASWHCIQDPAYEPLPVVMETYYVVGPGEQVDMNQTITDWRAPDCDLSAWRQAQVVLPGISAGIPETAGECGMYAGWELEPDPLPQMELTPQRLGTLRSATGVKAPKGFPAERVALTIAAHTRATLILDQDFLTNAYFTLAFSGGKDATITAGYQEAYFTQYPNKGNRNEIDGKTFIGRQDRITSNGQAHQQWTSLYWRTYRYVQLDIETQDEALTLDDVYGTFTGFPLTLRANLETDDQEMQQIFDIGWRTARLCAVDTYTDCPYYEQLQYLGDSRIQALITLFTTGDTRLPRNFLRLTDLSRRAEGITMSRYPETTVQIISPFSLWYICAVHDYMMYADDLDFVRSLLPGTRQILNYYARYQLADGSVSRLPGWNFTDWVYVDGWTAGVADKGADGTSALIDLQLLLALQTAAEMEESLGIQELASHYRAQASQLRQTIQQRYWDASRKLYADRMERDHFSQHANALAILAGMVQGDEARALAERLLTDSSLAPASVYFKYYLHQALIQAGLGDRYMDWLGIWRDNIRWGLTTWAETLDLDGVRSDCHAWGASPNIEFLRTVLGIDSDASCFARVRIEPHLGAIRQIAGTMPHPKGDISVSYQLSKKGVLTATITLPEGVTGRFIWQGEEHALQGGTNQLELK